MDDVQRHLKMRDLRYQIFRLDMIPIAFFVSCFDTDTNIDTQNENDRKAI